MATFIHNEPTSLAIIQEAALPEVFYKAIESGLEPAIEVRIIYPYLQGKFKQVMPFLRSFRLFQMRLVLSV